MRGRGHRGRPRVVYFAEIPTPYNLPTLAALARLVDLTVVFGADRGSRGLNWQLDTPAFRHRVVGGRVLRRDRVRGTDVYVDPRIWIAIGRARPDVIISPAFSLPTAFAALHGAVAGSQLIIYSVGTSQTEGTIGLAQRLARRLLIGRAAACVGLSTDAVHRFEELGCRPERLFCVPHATALDALWAIGVRRRRGTVGTLRVLAVGRFIPRKGIDRVIQAVAIARDSEPRITLDVVGTGPQEERLRELANRCAPGAVRFHGFADQRDLPTFYANADLFAFPSLRDQFGIVALEAAAAGLALLASPRAGATTDLVQDGRSGFVVDPDDVEAMADRLLRFAADPDLRLRMGTAARERTAAHHPDVAASRYANAIERVLATDDRRGDIVPMLSRRG